MISFEPLDVEASSPTSTVLLNEVMSDNRSTAMDPSGAFSDWVELYNPTDVEVSLASLRLQDDSGARWEGGEGTLAPGGRLLVWLDGDPFAVDKDGDALTLSVGADPVDWLATGSLGEDLSLARHPDGGGWARTARPTPGYGNGAWPLEGDASAWLFEGDGVLGVDVVLGPGSRASLEDDPYTDASAGIGVGGAWLEPVGVRLKGGVGSFRGLNEKAALRIDLDALDDHRLRGLSALTLNNMVQDPTYLREHLAYALFRAAGLPAPRTRWIWLTLDGEDMGLYLLVEPVDEAFLGRWYADATGALYEGAYQVDLYAGMEGDFEYDAGPDPEDRSHLTETIAALDAGDMEALAGLVDLALLQRYMAAEALTMHWDGYTTANNFRLYHDPASDQLQLLPWGTDQAFVTGDYFPYAGQGRLFTACLSDDDCRAGYEAAVRELAALAEAEALWLQIEPLQSALAEAIAVEPRREHSDDALDAATVTLSDALEVWPAELVGRIEAR